ncbi:hypothetical protein SKAU_G00417530 [Synaphobranchus kaupii]|uniref:Uncharacterized protein n=1 Tax=Synaphobranchus kaupii TaxID=118154 RepID=A0A9Q1E618_SYNKA|nr:hypothetical protein SKAU_G00417530 [Synaphobranchus kaupii]
MQSPSCSTSGGWGSCAVRTVTACKPLQVNRPHIRAYPHTRFAPPWVLIAHIPSWVSLHSPCHHLSAETLSPAFPAHAVSWRETPEPRAEQLLFTAGAGGGVAAISRRVAERIWLPGDRSPTRPDSPRAPRSHPPPPPQLRPALGLELTLLAGGSP